MSKIRKPNFYPQLGVHFGLERRLTPSAIASPPAEVQVISPPPVVRLDEPPTLPPSTPYPPSGGGEPPIVSPTVPGGDPSGPALAI